MPPDERRALFGLMIGHEGNTRIPVYAVYTQAGFDPDKDMLQANILPPDAYTFGAWWVGRARRPSGGRSGRLVNGGGLVFDWDLTDHATRALRGRRAAGLRRQPRGLVDDRSLRRPEGGRVCARAPAPEAREAQIEAEKRRVYAAGRTARAAWAGRKCRPVSAGSCRTTAVSTGVRRRCELGLEWLREHRRQRARRPCTRATRTSSCATLEVRRATRGGPSHDACLSGAQGQQRALGFKRIDYPEMDPPEWDKLHRPSGGEETR